MTMNALNQFMQGIIDYAGLFPPAGLPMAPAVENYAAYRAGPHHNLLGRFICPTTRFDEFLASAAPLLPPGGNESDAWPISALGRGGNGEIEFLANLEQDLADMHALVSRLGNAIRMVGFETRLPVEIVERVQPEVITRLAAESIRRIAGRIRTPITPCFEISLGGDWRRNLPEAIAALAAPNREVTAHSLCRPAVVKLRTGGVEAEMFPSVDQLTLAVRTCLSERLAFKATAGLHHPLRRFDESVGTKMHGFLNLFGAAVLAHAHDLDANSIGCILNDEQAEHFRFDEDSFCWQNVSAQASEIDAARREFAHSFGSCSFEEPVADLQALGML